MRPLHTICSGSKLSTFCEKKLYLFTAQLSEHPQDSESESDSLESPEDPRQVISGRSMPTYAAWSINV